jgi:hypothetical protein
MHDAHPVVGRQVEDLLGLVDGFHQLAFAQLAAVGSPEGRVLELIQGESGVLGAGP